MEGGQQEEAGGKGDNADPPTGPGIRNRGFYYVPFSRRHRPRRERIRIYRDLPRRSLVNLYSFLSVRYEKNRATTHVDVDLLLPHEVHCER